MYFKILLLIILSFSALHLYSQQIPSALNRNNDFISQFSIRDNATGKSFINKYPDITGCPFLINDWKYSLIKLRDGKSFDKIKTRLNLYENELNFITANDVEMSFNPGYVKEVNMYDSPETKIISRKFKTGFPKTDGADENTFYEILSEGNVSILRLVKKKITVNKNNLTGEVVRRFDDYEDYYIFLNSEMKRLKRNKDFILNALPEKKDKIEAFIKEHTFNYKIINDVIKLIAYYNSISMQ